VVDTANPRGPADEATPAELVRRVSAETAGGAVQPAGGVATAEARPTTRGRVSAATALGTDRGASMPLVSPPPNAEPPMPDRAGTAARRVRKRLARLGAGRASTTPPQLEPLFHAVRASHPKADLRPLAAAYEVAEECHRGQFRGSGDPYITHPLAVTVILAELGMDVTTLIAALLHDTVEDTPLTLTDVRDQFGDDVAALVDGVTKLDKVKLGEAAEAETIRKMVVAMARDPRVLVIKLADRMHNMRTLHHVPPEKQERTAKQTLEIYAPLAHRLGMNTIKWELEDRAFATLYPKRYDEIVRLVAERAPSRETYLAQVIQQIDEDLRSARIRASVRGRPKHYYSIYQKMIVRGRDFTDIYDLIGIRVLVDSVRDCYAALGTIHAAWNPVPGRFKDYIAMPKFNMYQSLHTTVIGPEGKPVEIQIRSVAMHHRSEYGIAAHWKYKEMPTSAGQPAPVKGKPDPNEMAWLRQLLDWQREAVDPGEFLDSLRFDLHAAEVFVFTPKGDVLSLPTGATPVDFAYAVHTEVGRRCIGARVNGRLVPLESTLDNGDVVEIFTSKAANAAPSRDWLIFVKSPRARTKIRQYFARERREDAIDEGKDAISRAMRKAGLPLQRLLAGEALVTIAKDLHYNDVSTFYAAVGEGHVSAQSVVSRLMASMGGPEGAVEDLAEVTVPSGHRLRPAGDPGVVVKGVTDVWVKLARCCTPVPGDEIIGFVTRGHGVSVHRLDCTNVDQLATKQDRMVVVEWVPSAGSVFLVAIEVEALDRTRLLSDVTRVLSDAHVNILSASVSTSRDRVAISKFTFEMGDPKHLGHLLRQVRGVEGVYDAYRTTNC
jgi:GTP diphosphokinase / guanosine-3',5'-bis(diphosphate) 3'-diphosphatase